VTLTCIDLESGRLQAMILQAGLELQVLTELQLQQSIDEILQLCLNSDVWIFAYGSLIPIILFTRLNFPSTIQLILSLKLMARWVLVRIIFCKRWKDWQNLASSIATSHKYAIAYFHC
jgi:hypothetical protein